MKLINPLAALKVNFSEGLKSINPLRFLPNKYYQEIDYYHKRQAI